MITQRTVVPERPASIGDPLITHSKATEEQRIDSLESFEIGGTEQWVLLRGNPLAGRVLLIVQQGPGLPLIHEADAIERRLRIEPHVLVAYWDQRGTGRSCGADVATLDLARLVSDVREMVDTLCARRRVDRVDIAGFSLGATLATMLAHLHDFDLRRVVSRVEIPITFFQGRQDFATPPDLVASYVDALDAPSGKSLVWFEASAHMPHYEEPARFREALLGALNLGSERGQGHVADGAAEPMALAPAAKG